MTEKSTNRTYSPLQMKRVLIALDYDPTAQKVAETGYSLAKTMNAEVTLLHVIADAVYYTSREYSPIMGFNGFNDISTLPYINVEALKDAAEKFLAETKKHLHDPGIKTTVREGDDASTILATASNIKADLIVMGSHSQRWLEKILIGSVTEEVLEKTHVPLFIVPTKEDKK